MTDLLPLVPHLASDVPALEKAVMGRMNDTASPDTVAAVAHPVLAEHAAAVLAYSPALLAARCEGSIRAPVLDQRSRGVGSPLRASLRMRDGASAAHRRYGPGTMAAASARLAASAEEAADPLRSQLRTSHRVKYRAFQYGSQASQSSSPAMTAARSGWDAPASDADRLLTRARPSHL